MPTTGQIINATGQHDYSAPASLYVHNFEQSHACATNLVLHRACGVPCHITHTRTTTYSLLSTPVTNEV